jgi:hypothetical protein
MSSEVYYRIYYLDRDNMIHVVEMQDFDEDDYHDHNFYRDENGEKIKFDTEEDAIKFLNQTFKAKHIHPDYRTAASVFERMKK